MSSTEYTVIYERAQDGSWDAYAPDLPGSGVVGETPEAAERLVREGIGIYLEELHSEGKATPVPGTRSAEVRISA